MTIKIKKLHPNATLPVAASEGAGAYDVTCTSIDHDVMSGKVTYGLGFAVEIPPGYRMMIQPRSGLTKTKWAMNNSIGLIDSDYRGECKVLLKCIPTIVQTGRLNVPSVVYEDIPYQEGERIAQVYLERVLPVVWEEAEELSSTQRGEGGFGSTGN